MAYDKPTHKGFWWFRGTFRGKPFDELIHFDAKGSYPIDLVGSDEIYELEDFVGEFLPLDWDVVKRGQVKE